MENDIKEITSKVKEEISNVREMDGLCYYASNNVLFDLDFSNIVSEMFNIREMADIDYDHYFVLADESKDKKYLIDLTYSQFVKKDGSLRFFDRWPSEVMMESEEGKTLLEKLLKDGYTLVNDNEFYTYLRSFNPNFEAFFTLDDVLPNKVR